MNMRHWQLNDVFTPYGKPTLTYVARPTLEKTVDQALSLPGAGLIVYGASGTGKTTLVESRLEAARIDSYAHVALATEFSEQDLYREIVTQLAGFLGPSQVVSEGGGTIDKVSERQKIFELLSKRPTPIFLDDARQSHVPILADFVKMCNTWSHSIPDPRFTLIIVGIDLSISDFTRRRRAEIPRFLTVQVNRFPPAELDKLISSGEEALHVIFSDELKSLIVRFSAGLPHVCHHVCYNICSEAGLSETCDNPVHLDDKHFAKAVDLYAKLMETQLDDLGRAGDLVLRGIRVRDLLNALFDAQTASGDQLGLRPISLTLALQKLRVVSSRLELADVREAVTQLTSPELGEILAFSEEHFSFREPLFRTVYQVLRGKEGPDRRAMEDLGNAVLRVLRRTN